MAKRNKAELATFEGYVVRDPYAVVRGPMLGRWLIVGPCFCGVRAIGRQVHMDGVTPGVVHRTVNQADLRHYPVEDIPLHSFSAGIKHEMLAHGASPLAVDWAVEFGVYFEDKELKIMADKLTAKAGKATKTKPVAGGGKLAEGKAPKAAKAPKGKGNPDGLAKAAAARAGKTAAFDAQKIKVAAKENPYRAGSKAYATFELIKQHKTVGDVKAAATDAHDLGYLRYASRDGHIVLS